MWCRCVCWKGLENCKLIVCGLVWGLVGFVCLWFLILDSGFGFYFKVWLFYNFVGYYKGYFFDIVCFFWIVRFVVVWGEKFLWLFLIV